jgi:trimeric autotransporter adhesin
VHLGQTTDTEGFVPWIRVWTPAGGTIGDTWGADAAALDDLVAPVTGTYLVLVASADSGLDGEGTYRLTLVKTADAVTVSAGDHGGPLTNGATHTGEILQGDVDVWTFTATAGDRVAAHIGEISDTDDFVPWIRVWTPAGGTIGDTWGAGAAALDDLVAPVTGTYLLLVASADSGLYGEGTYRLTSAKTPGPIIISAGDQGGSIPTTGAIQTGDILKGDVDVWTFTATAGQTIDVHIDQTAETADFVPWIRLWTPAGGTIGDTWGATAATLDNRVAPVTGTYFVLVASADSGLDGIGSYQLSVVKTP